MGELEKRRCKRKKEKKKKKKKKEKYKRINRKRRFDGETSLAMFPRALLNYARD